MCEKVQALSWVCRRLWRRWTGAAQSLCRCVLLSRWGTQGCGRFGRADQSALINCWRVGYSIAKRRGAWGGWPGDVDGFVVDGGVDVYFEGARQRPFRASRKAWARERHVT